MASTPIQRNECSDSDSDAKPTPMKDNVLTDNSSNDVSCTKKNVKFPEPLPSIEVTSDKEKEDDRSASGNVDRQLEERVGSEDEGDQSESDSSPEQDDGPEESDDESSSDSEGIHFWTNINGSHLAFLSSLRYPLNTKLSRL